MAKQAPPDRITANASEETLDLLTLALYLRENHKDELETAGVAGRAAGDYRARASARLYDFAVRYFTDQIDSIKREAVIAHLAAERRRGPHFLRLMIAAALGVLLAQLAVAVWRNPGPLIAIAEAGARLVREVTAPR